LILANPARRSYDAVWIRMDCPYQAGDRYDRFRLLRLLGDGTFAWVFAAEDERSETTVALKLSKSPITSQEMAVRARREIRVLRSLTSPHVVHVLDSGIGGDARFYLVMELLQGAELSALRNLDEPMSSSEAIKVIYQACLGLVDAHREGIVHRDLKPNNLWMCEDGTVKVIDFGLARSWDDDTIMGVNATQGHMLVGTPHYAQPEQVRSGKLTPASDVYSLGFILYELLTGRVPLFADERCSEVRARLANDPLEWLGAHVERPAVPLDRYPEGRALPEQLRDLVHDTLAKEPSKRPASAAALADHLRWFLEPEDGGLQGLDVLVLDLVPVAGAGRARRIVIGPGEHTIGAGRCCDIELADDAVGWVYALLSWDDPNRLPTLHPVRTDGFVAVGGSPLERSLELDRDARVRFGDLEMRVSIHRPQRDGPWRG
jgi:serine/threonine protein kinase